MYYNINFMSNFDSTYQDNWRGNKFFTYNKKITKIKIR